MTGYEIRQLDKNGRVAIPAPYRKGLGEKFVLTLSGEKCLKGYTAAKWDEMIADAEDLDLNPRSLTRNARELTFDAQGRVTLPTKLLEKRGIEANDEIAIVGVGSYIEIWKSSVWEALDEDESSMESVLEFQKTLRERKRERNK